MLLRQPPSAKVRQTKMSKNKQYFIAQYFFSSILILSFLLIFCQTSTAAIIEEKSTSGKPLPKAATFHFPEYAYKETSKNEITYREFEATCEQTAACEEIDGVAKIACVRRCISHSCYQDIYAFDELEAGEIDVRLNSFKGCVIQRSGNTNRL